MPMARTPSVIVVGGGVAGLAAACELGRAGVAVSLLESRERLGGRVFTQFEPTFDSPIELGAEFIHGRPRDILDLLARASHQITEVTGEGWCVEDGRLMKCDRWSDVDSILDKMDNLLPDESFAQFLDRCCGHPKTKADGRAREWAMGYVSGFNAADPALVGVHWLVQGMRAEEKIQGYRAFRSANGYRDLLDVLQQRMKKYEVSVHTETIVERVRWRAGHAEVDVCDRKSVSGFEAPRVLITLPLSLLKASVADQGGVEFAPPLPPEKCEALDKLEMGKVIRVVLRFRERFWDAIRPSGTNSASLSNMSFLFGRDEWFPTWWTTMPRKLPLITGWAPFRCAERLSGQSRAFVVERSLQTLSGLMSVSTRELQSLLAEAYDHDWQTDPFSLGAYSYGKVGSDGKQQALGNPVQNTLFFAGEATDTTGHNGTVHGAIASGYRAARQILQGLD